MLRFDFIRTETHKRDVTPIPKGVATQRFKLLLPKIAALTHCLKRVDVRRDAAPVPVWPLVPDVGVTIDSGAAVLGFEVVFGVDQRDLTEATNTDFVHGE